MHKTAVNRTLRMSAILSFVALAAGCVPGVIWLLDSSFAMSASAFCQDAGKDLDKFQGRWTVIRSERDGKPEPAKVLETLRVTISGGEFLLTGWDGEVIQEEFLFSLDPSRMPKAIDTGDGMTKKVGRGIYLLAEDRLTICGGGNAGRPKEFASKDGQSLLVLQRVKEPVKPAAPKSSHEQDVRKMQGRWKIVAAEDEGQDLQEEHKASKVVITGNKIVLHNNENERSEMIVTLRPDKRPHEIDLTVRWAGGKAESLIGIYALEDGELRLCFNMVEGQARPGTFKTKMTFTSRALFVLKRVQDGR